MGSLRRAYHRWLGHHERFYFAVLLTIVVLAWVVVPPIVRFLGAVPGYAPADYEPKDRARLEWLARREPPPASLLTAELIVDLLLLLAVAVVWLTLVPARPRRRRPP